jgi:hypothetical protein
MNAAQIAAAASIALQPRPVDGWAKLRSAYFAIRPSDDVRRGRPGMKIPFDDRLAATTAERDAVAAAAVNASGRAAELLESAAGVLDGRIAALEIFDQEFAACESQYRSATNELILAEKGLHFCNPDDEHDGVAVHMLAIEHAKAVQRRCARQAQAVLDGFAAMAKPVLPALSKARESVENVASLRSALERTIAERSADVAALAAVYEVGA